MFIYVYVRYKERQKGRGATPGDYYYKRIKTNCSVVQIFIKDASACIIWCLNIYSQPKYIYVHTIVYCVCTIYMYICTTINLFNFNLRRFTWQIHFLNFVTYILFSNQQLLTVIDYICRCCANSTAKVLLRLYMIVLCTY